MRNMLLHSINMLSRKQLNDQLGNLQINESKTQFRSLDNEKLDTTEIDVFDVEVTSVSNVNDSETKKEYFEDCCKNKISFYAVFSVIEVDTHTSFAMLF